MGEVFSYKTAAAYLGVSVGTIKKLVKAKQIAHFRVGRQVRIRLDALLDFIRRQEVGVRG